MILRRITEHVKTQNWFAVALDFVIVVVGVFVGIQVSNWNEAQHAAAKEAVILSQLHDEFTQVAAGLEEARPRAKEKLDAVRSVLRVIREGVEPCDVEAFTITLQEAGSFTDGPPEPVTLVELLASGTFSALSSPELRKALTAYHATMQSHAELVAVILDRASAPNEGFHDAVHVNPDHGSGDAPLFDQYDWDKLAGTRQQFQVLYYGKAALSQILDKLQSDVDVVMQEIADVRK